MSEEEYIDSRHAAEILVMYSAVFRTNDLTNRLLRLHALTEWYIERLINLAFPEPDYILSEGKFGYSQKLSILLAMKSISIDLGDALRRLTKLRNKCAHEIFPIISENQIVDLAQPIKNEFNTALQDREKDGLGKDVFHAYAWALFSQLSLQVSPIEIALAKSIWNEL